MKENRDARLRHLAIAVLNILEHYEEWETDLLDRIADAAYDLGLAENNEDGLFVKTEE
jgi:hypothetical protein